MVYKIQIKSSWCKLEPSNNTHKFISTFSFTKGPNAKTLTPTDANLSSISITWTPSSVSIDNTNYTGIELSVYPNPSTGIFQLDFKKSLELAKIEVYSITGQLLYPEIAIQKISRLKTLDLSNFDNGVYILNAVTTDGNSVKTIVFVRK